MSSTLLKFRELKPFEVLTEVAQRQKLSIICYWLTLESKNELSEEQIKEALRILFRNIDILHMCIRKENSSYWFCKMDEEKIPLQVLKNQLPSEVLENEVHTSFDAAIGPLWRAIYIANDEIVKESNTFRSNILFTFHHAVCDGYSSLNICNSFLKVLNDVIGENVQKVYDFGQLNDGHETEILAEKRMEYFKNNPEYLKSIQSKFDNIKFLLTEYLPVPKVVEKKTKFIHGELASETNTKLIKLFKSKGISFHAGISSVFNWVLMDIFTEKGLIDKEIELLTRHTTNLRKYWKNSSTVHLGTHSSIIKILSKTDKNIGENFWEYTKQFNKSLKNAMENMQGIDNILPFLSSASEESQKNFSKLSKENNPSNAYYCASNLGDISSIVQGQWPHVRIKWLRTGVSDHLNTKTLTLICHTFEGKFIYCMVYSAQSVTHDFANLCVDKIIKKLKIISNSQ